MRRQPQRPELRPPCSRHRPQKLLTLTRRHGVPYELERVVCSCCGTVIEERALRRAAA